MDEILDEVKQTKEYNEQIRERLQRLKINLDKLSKYWDRQFKLRMAGADMVTEGKTKK